MEQFEFRLQALMNLRKHREDAARIELARARRAMQQAQRRTEDLQLRQQAAAQNTSGLGKQPTVRAIQSEYARYHLLNEHRKRAHQQLRTAADKHENRRRTVEKAHQQLKTVQQLKDRKQQQHRERVKKYRRRLLDDTANIRAARRLIDRSRKLPEGGDE